ncbi:MAG: S8 family serine peptidase [Kurthia sp.]|nr:S8 family serine peptidase [Candidatus Kurthia equi]
MKKWLAIAALSITFCYVNTIQANAQEEVLISYENEQDGQLIEENLASGSYEVLPAVNTIKAVISSEEKATLHALPIHMNIDTDERVTTLDNKNPTLTGWNLQTLDIPKAWTQNYTGKGVKIAIIDTGVNAISALPNIKKRVSFVEDAPYTAINEADNRDRGYSNQGHGTSVASIIASNQSGHSAVQGIAPNAELYALKYADGTKSGVASSIVKAINWSIENQMDIINISSGLTTDVKALHQAVKAAHAKGIFIVASAGNDGQFKKTRFPARYAEVISVGSVNKYGDLSSFSNNLNGINFAAPGEGVQTLSQSGKIRTVNGTSFSAPHVTGLLALYKERFPYSKAGSILKSLKSSTSTDLVPHFKAPEFHTITDSVTVESKKVTDHQVNLKLNYSSLTNKKQAVILLNNQIIGYSKATSYHLKKLAADKKQKIEVRLIDETGNWSEPSAVTVKTAKDVTAPNAPSDFQAKLSNDGHVLLKWAQKKPGDFAKTIIYENNVKIGTTTSTMYQSKHTLKINKHYNYKLVTVDTTGNRSNAKNLTITRYK